MNAQQVAVNVHVHRNCTLGKLPAISFPILLQFHFIMSIYAT